LLWRADEDHLFITDPQLIGHILEHLGLWVQRPSRDPPSQEASHEDGEIAYEGFDDGWASYEDSSHPILPYLLPLHLPAAGTVGFQNYSLNRLRSISDQKQKKKLTSS
jgi:hypothetical protein